MIRVLVVDDQPAFRFGLSSILGSDAGIEVVGNAEDGEQATARALSLSPDVVMMDVRMPKLDGLEATRRILADQSLARRPKVIMLTTFDIDDYVFTALRAGASGFLLKDSQPEELVAAVHTVADGDALLAPRATRLLVEEFARTAPVRLDSRAVFAELTEREREVFRLIASGRSNQEIARELFIAEQTAKAHVSRILTKLGLRDRVQAVVLGYETGFITPGRPGRSGGPVAGR